MFPIGQASNGKKFFITLASILIFKAQYKLPSFNIILVKSDRCNLSLLNFQYEYAQSSEDQCE